MSKNNSRFRRSLSKRNTPKHKNQIVLYRYGVLDLRHKAKGYCSLHKCFISSKDMQEKHCNKKYCKHFIKQNLELFA